MEAHTPPQGTAKTWWWGFKTLNNKDNTLKHIVQSKTEQIYQSNKESSNVDRNKMVLFVTCIVKKNYLLKIFMDK